MSLALREWEFGFKLSFFLSCPCTFSSLPPSLLNVYFNFSQAIHLDSSKDLAFKVKLSSRPPSVASLGWALCWVLWDSLAVVHLLTHLESVYSILAICWTGRQNVCPHGAYAVEVIIFWRK